uniref:Uncharacterized protein n=1 Tax=Nelumbo nucifera TaxID=4432 RepID=A0A822Y680_NELNU|nr:TPA_asm: hypothetical protein HUJ06_029488 [Nelumbo nucifera]
MLNLFGVEWCFSGDWKSFLGAWCLKSLSKEGKVVRGIILPAVVFELCGVKEMADFLRVNRAQ